MRVPGPRALRPPQVLQHEWVASKGGILPRPLGQDVVFGAATVASIRRLRNLCGGVVAFNRAAAAAGSVGTASGHGASSRGAVKGDSAKDAYLRRLKKSQRLETSSRGGSVVSRMAAGLAGSAYAKAHDAGGSVHPADDVSVSFRRGTHAAGALSADPSQRSGRRFAAALPWRRRDSQASLQGGSLHGQAGDPSASRRNRFSSQLPGGLTRAGTTILLRCTRRPDLMLVLLLAQLQRCPLLSVGLHASLAPTPTQPPACSEMDRAGWSPSLSRKGSGAGSANGSKHALRGRSLASVNAGAGEEGGTAEAWAAAAASGQAPLQRKPSALALLSAAAKVYLDSSSHGGSRRMGGAFAALAAANGSGGNAGALRQVADDHSARSGKRLAAIADASTAGASTGSSSSGSGGALAQAQVAQGQAIPAQAAQLPPAEPAEGRQHGSPQRPPLLPAAGGSMRAGTPAPPGSAPSSSREPSIDGARDLAGLRPHRVVQRRSLDTPLAPGGASWVAAGRQQGPGACSAVRCARLRTASCVPLRPPIAPPAPRLPHAPCCSLAAAHCGPHLGGHAGCAAPADPPQRQRQPGGHGQRHPRHACGPPEASGVGLPPWLLGR